MNKKFRGNFAILLQEFYVNKEKLSEINNKLEYCERFSYRNDISKVKIETEKEKEKIVKEIDLFLSMCSIEQLRELIKLSLNIEQE